MLQQTQVKTVLPRYEAWFARFPSIAALAAAPLDDVLKAWEGLGYYRRARFIHAAANRIEKEFGGHFPAGFDDMLSLPGIGRSTAGAIASICFGMHAPVLDGNVKRVLKRWYACPQATERQLWDWAAGAIDEADEPGDWNQAMMELGATVCLPTSADCAACPVAAHCRSAHRADTGMRPASRPAMRDLYWRVELHACPERGIWLARRPDQGIWAGLWSPPITELDAAPDQTPGHVHQLSHRRLHLYLHRAEEDPDGPGRWARADSMPALPTGIRRLLEKQGISLC